MDRAFDAAVIGSGSAGTQAAFTLRDHGKSVVVIDERPFGGTCALRGCDPKKVLVHAAAVVDEAQRLAEKRILDRAPSISWPDLMRFKRTFTDPVPEERERSFTDAGIAVLHGRAAFADERTLVVNSERIRAEHIVIAAGARERHVASGDELLLTSETFMELEEMPPSLLFAGGGYVAFEFAHVAARAGAKVTILHNDAHPLAGFDRDLVERLVEITRSIGIEIQLDTPVESVERDGSGIRVHAKEHGTERVFRAAAGVLSAGRVANIDGLDLQRAGVQRTKNGVKVNEFLQSTGNPRVYAAGDAADSGGMPLTPAASYTGELAAQNLLSGNTRPVDFAGLATMVYTIPPLGSVGLSEAQARERGIVVDVRSGDMTQWYSTRHVAGRGAFYKTIVDKAAGTLLGAAVLGPHAQEQINVFALGVRRKLDAHAIEETLFAYPTGSSDTEYMLR